MANTLNKYDVGTIVTFRNHPLLYDFYIRGDGKYVPPLMIIKEVLFETKQKRTHDEMTGKEIAEKIKYICVYFDDNRSEFIESHLYESMIVSIENLHIARNETKGVDENHTSVVNEVIAYPLKPIYAYGKIIYFKTKKLEVLKKRTSKTVLLSKGGKSPSKIEKETQQYVVNYATPDFLITGIKIETYNDLFYNDGKVKRKASTELFKIQWFNPIQQKFSEQFLPSECFTDEQPFKTNVSHHQVQIIGNAQVIREVQETMTDVTPEALLTKGLTSAESADTIDL